MSSIMSTTRTGDWGRIKAGDWVKSIWVGDDLETYRAVRGTPGWTVRKSVAGAEAHHRTRQREAVHRS